MRRRFIAERMQDKNYCKAVFSVSIPSIPVLLYGDYFDSSQLIQIKIDGNKHNINQNSLFLSKGDHTIEYWFNNFVNGDYFICESGAHVDIVEFNVDTSNTTSMKEMFCGIASIVNLDHLDISNVTSMEGMFSYSKITESPFSKLQDTLHESCYKSMFYQCSSLINAPELPAATLVSNCYDSMFEGCNKLNYIKAKFITTPSHNYTNGWVYNVSPTGTFVKNPEATWDVVGSNGVPRGWTVKFDG